MKKKLLLAGIAILALVAIFGITLFIFLDNPDDENLGNQAAENVKSIDEWALTSEDCFPEEVFNEDDQTCEIICDTDEECERIANEIEERIEQIGNDYYEGRDDFRELDPEDANLIISYEVDQNEISELSTPEVSDDFKIWQESVQYHDEIWQVFTTIIPASQRADVVRFNLFTDGEDETLASVNQNEEDFSLWDLNVDIVDSIGEENLEELQYTLIHEFGHILTLRQGQLDLNEELLYALSDEEYDQLLEREEMLCGDNLYLMEGCSTENSYINRFYQAYWLNQEDGNYVPDMFVTEYASTDIAEDIAESWTAFILQDAPSNINSTIAEEKILFFYDYPELVSLRQFIRSRI